MLGHDAGNLVFAVSAAMDTVLLLPALRSLLRRLDAPGGVFAVQGDVESVAHRPRGCPWAPFPKVSLLTLR